MGVTATRELESRELDESKGESAPKPPVGTEGKRKELTKRIQRLGGADEEEEVDSSLFDYSVTHSQSLPYFGSGRAGSGRTAGSAGTPGGTQPATQHAPPSVTSGNV